MTSNHSPGGIAVVTTTVASAEEARRLAAGAVGAGLAACVQVEQIASHYQWHGSACDETEWRLSCKTLPATAPRLRVWLRAQHPYEVPQLLTHEVQAEGDYAQWVAQQVDRL
ncbi:divalent cation tolerance protein CutA [Melaminivora sp.]|uniref:divalent-cation tolerance protein CutA n=1 Tax=Melaminivora sp. TaxID=1933032 RepID=UPI0028A88E99|nr:divalent cation tolerance protein CutA [Melaminivora sp.]